MRIVGHSDQGGRPDGVQVMVHRGYAYIGHMFSKGFSIIDVRDPKNPRAGELSRRAARHLEHPPADPRRPAAGHQRQGHVRRRRVRRREGLLQGPARQGGRHRRRQSRKRRARLDRRPRGLRHFAAGAAAPHRLHAGRGRRHPSHLVHRRALGLCLGAARRLHRLHLHDRRHGRPDQSARGRPLVDSRHEPGRRRDAELAGHQPLRPAPRHRPRRHRLRRLARRRHGGDRRRRPRQAEADRASQRRAAVRRRHAQLPAAARPRPAGRARRGGARPPGGRGQEHLGVRQPRAKPIPAIIATVPAAGRGRLQAQGRPFRPAQHPREPARQLRELGADLRHLAERRRARVRHPATHTSRARSAPGCRLRQRA